ncbi:MAG TPA: DUF1015 domain-containing protein [Tepidiformaceae bacterium]|jgi:uncharacterized protein (DUF1015 family)
MPQILPIRGLRYTPAAGSTDDLLAPPYDVITPAQQKALESRNAHNAVFLELAEGGEDRYAHVGELLTTWEAAGLLHRDDLPMFYVYEQTFIEAGQVYHRRALITGVEAQPWEEGSIKPHEFTMSGPKEDRLKLLEATRTQLSPVFMIARDRAGQLARFLESTIASRPADITGTTIDGDQHAVWLVEASRYELRQLAPLLSESFYIADGHHRYETAVNYRNALATREGSLAADHPARFAMTAIVTADDPGLVIRSIHRIVPRPAPANWRELLDRHFDLTLVQTSEPPSAATLEKILADTPGAIVALNLAPGGFQVLRPREDAVANLPVPAGHSARWAEIAPNILRYGVLEPLWGITDDDVRAGAVEYTHDAAEVVSRLGKNPGETAFLLAPVTIGVVMALADQGERMPQKSTFFHPKLGTGLVFHPLYP